MSVAPSLWSWKPGTLMDGGRSSIAADPLCWRSAAAAAAAAGCTHPNWYLVFPPLIPCFFYFLPLGWLLGFCTKCHKFVGMYSSAKASALLDVQLILVKDFTNALKVGAYYHPCSTTHQFKLLLLPAVKWVFQSWHACSPIFPNPCHFLIVSIDKMVQLENGTSIFVVLHLVLPPRNWSMPSPRHVHLRMDMITMLQNLQMSKAQFK